MDQKAFSIGSLSADQLQYMLNASSSSSMVPMTRTVASQRAQPGLQLLQPHPLGAGKQLSSGQHSVGQVVLDGTIEEEAIHEAIDMGLAVAAAASGAATRPAGDSAARAVVSVPQNYLLSHEHEHLRKDQGLQYLQQQQPQPMHRVVQSTTTAALGPAPMSASVASPLDALPVPANPVNATSANSRSTSSSGASRLIRPLGLKDDPPLADIPHVGEQLLQQSSQHPEPALHQQTHQFQHQHQHQQGCTDGGGAGAGDHGIGGAAGCAGALDVMGLPYSWHEVLALPVLDPVTDQWTVLIMQTDVTRR